MGASGVETGEVVVEDVTAFFGSAEPRLRPALIGAFGIELGRDAAAEALAWGWENWERLQTMSNPVGYLYQVGRTAALRSLRSGAGSSGNMSVAAACWELPDFEPNLGEFIAGLPEQQRAAVWLVHGLGFTHRETAEVLGCSRPTVATHVRRALTKLRRQLGVHHG